MENIVAGGSGVALTIGLVQIAKGYFREKFHPLLSLVIGIIVGGGIHLTTTQDIVSAIFVGIVTGLTASGLYDQKKAVI